MFSFAKPHLLEIYIVTISITELIEVCTTSNTYMYDVCMILLIMCRRTCMHACVYVRVFVCVCMYACAREHVCMYGHNI